MQHINEDKHLFFVTCEEIIYKWLVICCKRLGQAIPKRVEMPDTLVQDVQALERTTKHEHVALCQFLRTFYGEHVNWCLTSEDVVGLARQVMWREKLYDVDRRVESVCAKLSELSRTHAGVPLAGRTHGQPASTTSWSYVLETHSYRLRRCRWSTLIHTTKFGGVVGPNHTDISETVWSEMRNELVNEFGFTLEPFTTQVGSRLSIVQELQRCQCIAYLCSALCVDLWIRGALGECRFTQGGVGSSAIANKNNPWLFESAEGTLEMFARSVDIQGLLCSRLERDLSDSPVQRAVSGWFDMMLLGLDRLNIGLDALELQESFGSTPVTPARHW